MRKLVLLAALLMPAMAFGQTIRNSAHDLSSSSTTLTLVKNGAGHNQICIYCHTPHRAQSTQFLWNHAPTTATTWQWGDDLDGNAMSNTTTGTPLPLTLRSGSKRCLGCHDGTVALGDLTNFGGGGAGILAGLESIGVKTDGTGKLTDANMMIGNPVAGTVGAMGGNHPVSIPYAGETSYNGLNSSVPAAWMGGAAGGYYNVLAAGCTSATGICTTAPASDGRNGLAINLIPDVAGGSTNAGIECSSCHEPHNKTGFTRFTIVDVANASGLCRSCHNK